MTKTARTALVELSPGWIIPYFFATSMVMSSISGNFTSTFFMPLYSILSLIVRSHAMWLYSPSTDRPTSLQLAFGELAPRARRRS